MIHLWYFWWKIHPGYMYQPYILYTSSLHEAMALGCLKRKQWNNGSCFAIFLGLSLENLDWDSEIQNKMDFWLPVHLNLNIDNPNYDFAILLLYPWLFFKVKGTSTKVRSANNKENKNILHCNFTYHKASTLS